MGLGHSGAVLCAFRDEAREGEPVRARSARGKFWGEMRVVGVWEVKFICPINNVVKFCGQISAVKSGQISTPNKKSTTRLC